MKILKVGAGVDVSVGPRWILRVTTLPGLLITKTEVLSSTGFVPVVVSAGSMTFGASSMLESLRHGSAIFMAYDLGKWSRFFSDYRMGWEQDKAQMVLFCLE